MKKNQDVFNFSDESNDFSILVSSVQSTKILDAVLTINGKLTGQLRTKIKVYNPYNKLLYIKSQEATVDNIKNSAIVVFPGESKIIYESPSMYNGELSAIFESGQDALINVSWI